uniref:Uncharacterized protein n=1 Tax=Arundo donax TaxID=35708 RepID=A0A0A9DN15_ARUDO
MSKKSDLDWIEIGIYPYHFHPYLHLPGAQRRHLPGTRPAHAAPDRLTPRRRLLRDSTPIRLAPSRSTVQLRRSDLALSKSPSSHAASGEAAIVPLRAARLLSLRYGGWGARRGD